MAKRGDKAAQIERLKKLKAELKDKITGLEAAGENAWGDMKTGAEEAWQALSAAFKKAASHFKNKT